MVKIFTRPVLRSLFIFSLLITGLQAFAQTVSIRKVDAGPYAPGSTFAAAITIVDEQGQIGVTGNRFQLFLSDANGSFVGEKNIGEFSGYYTGFINGLIPQGTVAGTGYRVRVKTTNPATVSAVSDPFTITTGTAVIAGASSSQLNAAYPEVYGTCFASDNFPFDFNNTSTTGSTATANFYNDLSQTDEQTLTLTGSPTFNAKTSNYTVFVKAVNNGIVGTKAYLLLNNFISNSFQTQNASSVCLPESSAAVVTYSVNINGAGGIQNNYPGTLYTIKWGDGTTTNFTYAQIAATNGVLTHSYTTSSCGARNAEGQVTNRFEVAFKVANQYCPDQDKTLSGDQAVLSPPKNVISGPTKGCTNKELTFTNISFSGQTVSSAAGGTACENPNATYQWYVNGTAVAPFNSRKNVPLKYTFTAPGTYTITLKLTSSSACVAPDAVLMVCIQDPPKPDFTINPTVCIGSGAIAPSNTSVVSNPCSNPITYTWTVTPATGFTYAGGTNKNSITPQFLFNTTGNYDIRLSIDNGVCDIANSSVKTITVSNVPTAALSPSFSLCGKGQTLTFDNTTGSATRTTFTGTVVPKPTTYTWTVTGQGGIAAATFENGTTANSQYPQIKFPDFGTYEVIVNHTNDCGSVTSNVQQITFKEAPTVLAGADQVICPGATAQLDGSVTGAYNTRVWTTTGTGTFSDNSIEKPIYTPSAADRAAGQVTLRLSITTSLPGDCATIFDEVVIKINPANALTSAPTKTICTGSAVNYTPESNVPGSVFNWTVTANSANASGFSASGTGAITDVLTNSSPNTNATVTYTIVPQANGCDGTPFTFTVTIAPKPEITLTGPAGNTICSGSAAGIQIASNISGTQYTWTVTADPNITGAANQTSATATTAINQILVNSSNAAATVTYTVTPVNVNSSDLCGGQPKIITITVQPQVPAANAGTDAVLCYQSSYILQGNDPGNFTGNWTLTSGQSGVTFNDPSKYNTVVNGLQPGQTYTFRWTITGAAQCTAQFDDVQVINNPPISGNTITLANSTSCANQIITITGSTPTGGSGTYAYLWESSADGTIWSPLVSQTGKDITIPVSATTYFRRSVSSGPCADDKSNVVQAIVLPAIGNNTISPTSINLCVNQSAGQLTGSTPDGADGTYTYQWQSSTDQGATWTDIAGANQINYTTPVLTTSIMYRRVVSSNVCQVSISAPATITIFQNPIAKILFNTEVSCAPFDLVANNNIRAQEYTDRNGEYRWYVNDVLIGTGVNFPASYILNAPGQSVTVKLVTVSLNNCQPDAVDTHVFKTVDQFTLGFTASLPIVNNTITVCGTTNITFTNTSTPITSATYNWTFNGGALPAGSTLAQPGAVTFTANPAGGDDRTYTVTLNANPQCGIATPKTITVIVTPAQPLPIIDATTKLGCSTLTTSVTNLTNGTNRDYTVFVKNATTGQTIYTSPTITTKDAQTITINEVGNFNIYMVATSVCGVQVTSSPVPVKVLPSNLSSILQVASGQPTEGCSPLSVTFNNLSNNVTSYWYDWGDGSRSEVFTNAGGVIPAITHIYIAEGTFFPKVHSGNACTLDQVSTDFITIVVHARPVPAFTLSRSQSATCNSCTVVKFNNTTPDATGNITYTWSFGDGTAVSHDKNPEHEYDYNKGATYTVKLTASNIYTCEASITRIVEISAPVTQLSLPNAFTPGSLNPELNIFRAKGTGLKAWHVRIFNNYGQMVWESTKLDARGEPADGWDGTFSGTPMPQGVYIWQAEATFIDGSEWKGVTYNNSSPKRTGVIHLIR